MQIFLFIWRYLTPDRLQKRNTFHMYAYLLCKKISSVKVLFVSIAKFNLIMFWKVFPDLPKITDVVPEVNKFERGLK